MYAEVPTNLLLPSIIASSSAAARAFLSSIATFCSSMSARISFFKFVPILPMNSQKVSGLRRRMSSNETPPSTTVSTAPDMASHMVTSLPSVSVSLDTYSLRPVTGLYPTPPPFNTSTQSTPSASSMLYGRMVPLRIRASASGILKSCDR